MGAHGSGDGGQEYIITRDEIHAFREVHTHVVMKEAEIADVIAQVLYQTLS